ncbi:serine/threonine-protein kinase [Mastigocoleus sp. MO_188.B34]|uniref:serine/threonine-protein kinase n=1 Tax=Mastigocoleus sp. MO_188.B34 TaxID=3036635 RepID=UPI00262CFF00|nr:serine/threonine-protein kinase [Mastigocoleus sp. MO_188.B34]MDJ0693086.1 serine/threonine-protein kinase [Mastigocoleus sp. MO_188.B34]
MLHQNYDNQLQYKTELDRNIGKLLNNRYLIRDLIGKGKVSRVYLAEDTAKGGTPVAVKILFLNLPNRQIYQSFVQEIFIATQLGLRNNHIVRILGYGLTETEDKHPFYVMEYLPGKSLKSLICSRSLNLPKFLNIFHQICLGLQAAHKGVTLQGKIYPIIHRNIKPENIFITDDLKKSEVVKILDFGIANFLVERSQLELTESLIHNLPYCSPEDIEERKSLDVRSDIYSLGITMYEVLIGKYPFDIKNYNFMSRYEFNNSQNLDIFQGVNPQFDIPQQLKELIVKCLNKDTNLRPKNIDDVIHQIENLHSYSKFDFKYQVNTLLNNRQISLSGENDKLHSEKSLLREKWPANQPIEKISFPHILSTKECEIPAIMAMLPKKDINRFTKQSQSVEFIIQKDLYPMLLWVTAIEAPKLDLFGYIPHFLDLKNYNFLKILQLLSNFGYYHLLFFSLENPENCCHVKRININQVQRQELVDFLGSYQRFKPVISSKQCKAILKLKFERIKQNKLKQNITEISYRQNMLNYWRQYISKMKIQNVV